MVNEKFPMFETAELGHVLDKKQYRKRAKHLRVQLLEAQDAFRHDARRQMILLFAGVDGAGKGETVNLLNGWMDPRWMVTRAYDVPNATELEKPPFSRFWRDLPPRGRIGMFLSAWYSQAILDHVYRHIDDDGLEVDLERIERFERALTDDGAIILKFWMHLSKAGQERRLRNLADDPLNEARVTESDWENWRHYDRFIAAAERAIPHTNTADAPWFIIEGEDSRYREIRVAELVLAGLERGIEERRPPADRSGATDDQSGSRQKGKRGGHPPPSDPGGNALDSAPDETRITVLSTLDMNRTIDKTEYTERLRNLQAALHVQHHRARSRGVASVLVFEGPDAAGKGGAIRRINAALDARNYQVHGVAKPTEEELAQHYLWRFWRNVPRDGRIAIFDRSWYGRVLVERIEGFATQSEWRRAYAEINDFEQQLTDHGIVVMKFWIHITPDEQLARFKARKRTTYKRWKLTDEDWRNRDRWSAYEEAVNDMVQYTSTANARWHLVEGNQKQFARIKVLETFLDQLRQALD